MLNQSLTPASHRDKILIIICQMCVYRNWMAWASRWWSVWFHKDL